MSAFGVHGSAVICLIGLALVPVVLTAQGSPAAHQVTRSNAVAGSIRTFSVLAVIALMAIMFLRAWTQSSITTYVPVFFTQVAGFSVQEASRISSVNLFALAAGGLVGGMLSDRFGGRRVMIISWLIYAPAVLLLFGAPDARVYLIAAVAGFVAGASWPPLIVMAQELFPKNAGVASGIALGFAFAMGGIGTTITGWLAEPEHLGLTSALLMLSVLPLISALLAFLLPRDARRQPITQPEPATATAKS
jgi:FSR family fosmidomycin resistance protein-like MFS transporter